MQQRAPQSQAPQAARQGPQRRQVQQVALADDAVQDERAELRISMAGEAKLAAQPCWRACSSGMFELQKLSGS
jgi:hypothetical protein